MDCIQLPTRAWAANADMTPIELARGGIVGAWDINISGTHTTIITAGRQDAPIGIIRRFRLAREGIDLLNVQPDTYQHMLGFYDSAYSTLTNAVADGGAHDGTLSHNLLNTGPGPHGVDLTDGRSVQGVFTCGVVLDLGTACTAIASNLRMLQHSIPPRHLSAGAPLWEPLLIEASLDASASSVDQDDCTMPSGAFYRGLLFRAYDASGDPAAHRVDGLVRRVTVKIDGQVVADVNERLLQERGRRYWRQDAVTADAGVYYLPLPAMTGAASGLLHVPPASTMTVHLDTATAVTSGTTAITPAAGDRVFVMSDARRPNQAMARALGL